MLLKDFGEILQIDIADAEQSLENQMRSIMIILFGAVSYGLLSTFVKLAYHSGFSTNDAVGSQLIFGIVMMLLVIGLIKNVPVMKGVSVKSLIALLPTGITVGATSILYYSALQYIPASIAIVLLFQFTWMGVLIEAVIERKRSGKEKMTALVGPGRNGNGRRAD